jgi:dimethylhistidine N-methyltransferase
MQKAPIVTPSRSENHGFEEAVLEGLTSSRKRLSPKYLYDQRGSELFDRICECKDYYVTRTETSILERHAADIARAIGARPVVYEFGSGASRKTRILLRELEAPAAYVPIDISREFLLEAASRLSGEFPSLPVLPLCADFTQPMPEVNHPEGRRLAFFPGSTIGNFHLDEAEAFLSRTAEFLGAGGRLLVGVDLLKDRSILEPAYDDSEGVTAEFNLNLLHRMRSELGANVDPANFRHRAIFNEEKARVEMHLESLREQSFEIKGRPIHFHRGETIHTECSYKYDSSRFEELAHRAGFVVGQRWTDDRQYFALYLLEAVNSQSLAA